MVPIGTIIFFYRHPMASGVMLIEMRKEPRNSSVLALSAMRAALTGVPAPSSRNQACPIID